MGGWRSAAAISLLLLAITAAACGGSSDVAPAFTSEPTPESANLEPASTPGTAPSVAAPDTARILEHIRQLSEVIGPRPGGSAKEKAAADYLAQQLSSYGYDVELQDFIISNDGDRASSLSIEVGESDTIVSIPMEGSGAGIIQGALVAIRGAGDPGDFTTEARGAIVLIERGKLLFRDKVANAGAAGAIGVIIQNDEPGIFFGNLGGAASLPTVSISQAEGKRLRALANAGPVNANLSVDVLTRSVSHNVVAKPPNEECETISGGHYDSVTQAPGANDNASGTAVVLELARLLAAHDRAGSNCFVLFGSEELGLLGSRAFVGSLEATDRARLKAMLNFDMVGVGDEEWRLIGSAELQERASVLSRSLGITVIASSTAGTGLGSDHASFIEAGIPAFFLHRTNDAAWHTPQDAYDRIEPEHVETAARLGMSLLNR